MRTLVRISAVIVAALIGTSEVYAQSGPYQYYPLTPCRVIDTRNPDGTNGGPILGNTQRDFSIRNHCGVPLTAKAVSANVTVAYASAWSWLTIWPSGQARPFTSTINYDQNSGALGNGAILGLSANTNDLSVVNANGTTHLILDVTGYFQ